MRPESRKAMAFDIFLLVRQVDRLTNFLMWLAHLPCFGVKYQEGVCMCHIARLARLLVCGLVAALASGCGGGGGDSVMMAPPAAPDLTPPEIAVNPVFTFLPAFDRPVAMKQAPGDDSRWFVAEKNGVIRAFANNVDSSATSVFLEIPSDVSSVGEGGLLGFAFHPDFPRTPAVYISYTRSGAPLVSYISRFLSTDDGQTLNGGSEEVILTVLQPETNHNGGDLMFGPDGFLYAGFGDGGGSGDPLGNGQDDTNLHGSIIRIDVSGDTTYSIPADNPNATNGVCTQGYGGASCPEIFAWGLRNPWRFSFDAETGTLWAGDVGQGSWEEIDRIESGENYGWNVREGAHCFSPATGCADTFTDPVTEYDHSVGRSVTGGYVYRGSSISDLIGWYIFGDFISGRIFAVGADSASGVAPEELLDTSLSIVSFAEDNNNELYVLDYSAGTMHKIEKAP
jgi:glucose/arabinose dehydrogenase